MSDMVDRGGVRVASNQLQYSLLDRRPENGMAEFCQQHGISLLPYGVLAGGLMSDAFLDVPASAVKLDTFSKRKYSAVIEAAGGWDWFQRLLRVLRGVADRHDSNIANVASRWVLDRPGVAGVILGARNALHLDDHVALASLKLDEQDLAGIQEVLEDGKRPRGDCYQWERGLGPW
jgi:aryl-alcohol dehydrogenase-like predicted oxidoreductase